MNDTQVTLRIPGFMLEEIKKLAVEEHRTATAQIRKMLETAIARNRLNPAKVMQRPGNLENIKRIALYIDRKTSAWLKEHTAPRKTNSYMVELLADELSEIDRLHVPESFL